MTSPQTRGSRSIGVDLPRPEGPDKVAGRTRYVADLRVAGAWVGGTVRSPVAHGRLLGFDHDPGFDLGSVTVVGPDGIPGDNVVALIRDDQPLLASGSVQHFGEPLLLVAAPDRETLRRALASIRPRIEELPAVLDAESAPEVLHEIVIEKGDPLAVLGTSEQVVEGTYWTDSQEQMYIETQGFVAFPPDEAGELKVVGSLQCPYYVRKALARALALEPEQARVVQAPTGGGFGGKEDYPSVLACHAALLARACGRPVRMIYDRHEDLAVTPKRHPARVRHRTAVAPDGELMAMEIDVLLDGGAYATLSPVVLSRACIHAAGPYRCANIRIRGRAVRTNHVPYGAFRGFGAPQVCFAVERQMDRLANVLEMHPCDLRVRNMLRSQDDTATGQKLVDSVGSEAVMRRILSRSRFDLHPWKAPKTGSVRRGVGFSFFFHGAGFTGSGEELLKGRVRVELTPEGRARIYSASTEFGQGTLALFTAIAAESLAVEPGAIELAEPDTGLVPDSGPTVASRTCMIVGGCLAKACRELAERLKNAVGEPGSFEERVKRFLAQGGDGVAEVVYGSPADLVWDEEHYRGDAYPAYGWAADVAEVEVDMDTFEVRVTRFLTAVDVGRALQPKMVLGQIEGGSLQAIGFAHLEVVSSREGRVLQDRMATCIVPTSLDAPPMEVELVEVPFEHGPFGAKGVGELPMDGGAPAVASAIEDATGLHVDRVPATPERLLEMWLETHPEEESWRTP